MSSGGKREGAGRKPALVRRKSITVRLPVDLIERMPPKKTKFIEAAVLDSLASSLKNDCIKS